MFTYKEDLDPRFFAGIAHRGFHDGNRTENGLEAFSAAIEKGFAFEYDIHLSKDGRLIVVHDSDLKRVTGREGKVEELTLKAIKDDYRLLDGEELPAFEEVVDLNDGRVPMVIELKAPGGGKAARAIGEAARKAIVGRLDPKKTVIISFDPRALLSFGRGSGYHLSLLVCLEKKWTLYLRSLFDSIDIDRRLVEDPRIADYRAKGRLVNVWTIRSQEEADFLKGKVDMLTFEGFDYRP